MSNTWFQFKQFKINQDKTAMKVGVDSVLLGAVASFDKPHTILDIGTGTGLLSFMAEQRTDAQITAIEIDKDAYIQCKENVELNNKTNKIKVHHSSLQDFAYKNSSVFDHIICNPPYFENSSKSTINSRNTARHADNLPHNELVTIVLKLLSEKGTLSLILPYEKHENFIQLSIVNELFCNKRIIIFPNEFKKANRVVLEFSKKRKPLMIEKVILRNKLTNEYTKQYKELTKDFYLKP